MIYLKIMLVFYLNFILVIKIFKWLNFEVNYNTTFLRISNYARPMEEDLVSSQLVVEIKIEGKEEG